MSANHEVPPGGRGAGASSADAHLQNVSVADILNRQVPLDWFESVAIVAGLCSALGEHPATVMPALEDIHLTPDGTIALVAFGRRPDDAVIRLLHDCLTLAAQPAALRLFVINALSSDRYWSPSVLQEALAYYERPGRAAIIRGARAKCLSASGAGAADASAPSNFEVHHKAAERSATAGANRRRRALVAVGIVGVAGIAGLSMLAYSHGLPAGSIGDVRSLAASVAEAGRGLVDTVKKTLISAPAAPATATADATPVERPKKPRRIRTAVAPVSPEQPASIATATPDNEGTNVVAEEAPASAADAVDASLVAPTNLAPIVDNNELMPPRLVDPVRLPKWAFVATDRSSHAIELTISETGKVARVRLVSPAVRMTDMMMLSAAKTWTFEPASQNGRPTPYTLVLNVTDTP